MKLNILSDFRRILKPIFLIAGLCIAMLIISPFIFLITTGIRLDPAARWAASRLDKALYPKFHTTYLLLHWQWREGLRLTGKQVYAKWEDESRIYLNEFLVSWPNHRIRKFCALPLKLKIDNLSIYASEDGNGRRYWLPPESDEKSPTPDQPVLWPLENLPSWLWPDDVHPIEIQLTKCEFEWNLPSINALGKINIPEARIFTAQCPQTFFAGLNVALETPREKLNTSLKIHWDSLSETVSLEMQHDPLCLEYLATFLPPSWFPIDYRIAGNLAIRTQARFKLGDAPALLAMNAEWKSDNWEICAEKWLPESITIAPFNASIHFDESKGMIQTSPLKISLPWTQFESSPMNININEPFNISCKLTGDFSSIHQWLASIPEEASSIIPIDHPDLAHLAIGKHQVNAEATFSPWVANQFPALQTFRLNAETEVRIAKDKIPIRINGRFDAQDFTWETDLKTGAIHPFLWQDLSIIPALPINLQDFNLGMLLNFHATGSMDTGPDQITLTATIPHGEVGGLLELPQPIPIKDFEFHLVANPTHWELLDFSIRGNFCGADLKVINGKGKLDDDEVYLQAIAQISQLDFEELYHYLPEELANNEILTELNPAGTISMFQIDSVIAGNINLLISDPLSLIQECQLDLIMDNLSISLTPEISLQSDKFFLAGNLNEISIDIPLVQIAEIQIPKTQLRVENPLDQVPLLTASTSFLVDLSHIQKIEDYFPTFNDHEWIATLKQMNGKLHGAAEISLPITLPVDPSLYLAKVNVEINELTIPGMWMPYQKGSASIQAQVEWDGSSIRLNSDYRFDHIQMDPWLNGPLTINFSANSNKDLSLNATLMTDLSPSGIDIPLINQTKAPGERALIQINFSTSAIAENEDILIHSRIQYDLWGEGAFAVQMLLDPTATTGLKGIKTATISDINILDNHLKIETCFSDDLTEIRLQSRQINIPETLDYFSPLVYDFLLSMETPEDESKPIITSTDSQIKSSSDDHSIPAILKNIHSFFHIDKLILSPSSTLINTSGKLQFDDFSIQQAIITGHAESQEILKLEVSQPLTDRFHLYLSLPDVAGIANILVSPLHLLELPDTPIGNNLDVLRRIPESFEGGRLLLDAIWQRDKALPRIEGKFSCIDLYMIKAPCLLRLVATTSGKGFSERVAFRTFSIDHFALDPESISLQILKFEGPFSMNIEHGMYRFSDQFIHVKGDHFLTNFEIEGMILGPPKIYLDNRATRWMGTDESDWSGM